MRTRAGRSIETSLTELTGVLQKSLDESESVIYAFLAVEGAFDHTSHEAVMGALERIGVDGTSSR